ncbi:MAG: hypothetical protein Q7S16_03280 [bacterium]|nr:hypothetical protein [bacterium]
MPTLKRRLNISLSATMDAALTHLAKRDDMPTATKAVDLLRIAFEVEEDELWDQLARGRDTKKASFVPHHKAWA